MKIFNTLSTTGVTRLRGLGCGSKRAAVRQRAVPRYGDRGESQIAPGNVQTRNTRTAKHDAGIVSITVTIIMMLVISVIVLGFAEISRREARQSLDRQLSEQAFLAAETGVNDARSAIQKSLQITGTIPNKNNCPKDAAPPYNMDPVIDAPNNVSYTCLLIDTTLDSIQQIVKADGSAVMLPLRPEGASQINALQLKWTGDAGATNANCPNNVPAQPFPGANAWPCDFGILRVDLVPTGSLNHQTLLDQQRAFFFYPTKNGPIPNQPYGPTAAAVRGSVTPMSCTNLTNYCRVKITGISGSATYAIRLSGVYKPGTVEITGTTAGGAPIVFTDAQALVDATGKAGDVLRRIQVRLSLGQTSASSGISVQSGSSLCKRFSVTDTNFRIAGDIAGQDANNPMCRPLEIGSPLPLPPPLPAPCRLPYEIIFVLDRSDSMKNRWERMTRIEKLKDVASSMVRDLRVSEDGLRAGIVSFDKDSRLGQSLTGNQGLLISSIRKMVPSEGTVYGKALDMASAEYDRNARPGVAQVMIFMSDGRNDDSESGIDTKVNTLKARGVRIYTVGISEDSKDVETLKRMPVNGGRYAYAANEADLDRVANDITGDYNCDRGRGRD